MKKNARDYLEIETPARDHAGFRFDPQIIGRGTFLAEIRRMDMFICDHCRCPFQGKIYRVRSEEAGIVLLNMVVCHSCYLEAARLRLNAEEIVTKPSNSGTHPRLAHWFRKAVGSPTHG